LFILSTGIILFDYCINYFFYDKEKLSLKIFDAV